MKLTKASAVDAMMMRATRPLSAPKRSASSDTLLALGSAAASMPDDAEVCGCNGVKKGTICKAIKDKGLFTLEEVRKHTKASEAKRLAEDAMKNAKSDIDFAKAQGEFAAMAAQIAAIRKFRGK